MAHPAWSLALNTLLLSGATCAIAVPIGTLLAWLLVRTNLPGRRIALILVAAVLFLPLYLQAAAWKAGFGDQGWCSLACGGPVWLQEWRGAIWVHAMAGLPWVVLIVGVGFWLVEPELEEQALVDGSAWQVFSRVTLRTALPAVGIAGLWVFIVSAGEITVTDLFGVRTYAEELYTWFVAPDSDAIPLGVVPGVVVTAGLVCAGLALCAGLVPRDRPISSRARPVFGLGHMRLPVALIVAAVLVVMIGVPLGNLCYKAGVVVTPTDRTWLRSWSLGKCLTTVGCSPARYQREFGWSLGIGALAATAAVVAGTGAAWFAVGRTQATAGRRVGAGLVLALAAVCLATPGPVIGLAVIRVFNRPGWPMLNHLYDQSILAPWLVLSLRGLPPALFILWHALRTVPLEMMECAALDGAGPWTRLWRVALPGRLHAMGLAWIVAFAVVLADLAASVLVVPPGLETLAIRIFGQLHSGVEDQVAGICLAQMAIFALLALGCAWLAKRAALESTVREGR